MRRFTLTAIVEGHGEQFAIPLLMRRWLHHRRFKNFDVTDPAVRAAGCGALKAPCLHDDDLGVEHYVDQALRSRPDGILIVLDADDECVNRLPHQRGLGPSLLERATRHAPHVPISVVVANREYEAWLLGDIESLVLGGGLPADAREKLGDGLTRLDSMRDAKGQVGRLLGRAYEPSTDQKALTSLLSFGQRVRNRCRSYDKLLRELESLTQRARRMA